MGIPLNPNEPAIVRGIKTVGVGKKGSKALSPELALEIAADLKADKVPEAARGAFCAGLTAKGFEPHEEILANDCDIRVLTADAPEFVQWACRQLLGSHKLDKNTAYGLGKFLFSSGPGDVSRGWVASFLRVRYETEEEYQGLWQAMQETLEPAFKIPAPEGDPIIQMAEPFDGVDHSYMITPLVARALQQEGYRVVHQVGNNSGPKMEMNLWDIVQALGVKAASSNADLALAKPEFGWVFHQSMISKALDRWVDLRRQIVKRPFLATLERFVNPLKADILIASAFHPPYGEKMLALAENAGFKHIIIVRNGIEGTIAFPLMREVKLLLSCRQKDGSFKRHELLLEITPSVDKEEMIEKPDADVNAGLMRTFIKKGVSGSRFFDLRLELTCQGLIQGLAWLKDNS